MKANNRLWKMTRVQTGLMGFRLRRLDRRDLRIALFQFWLRQRRQDLALFSLNGPTNMLWACLPSEQLLMEDMQRI